MAEAEGGVALPRPSAGERGVRRGEGEAAPAPPPPPPPGDAHPSPAIFSIVKIRGIKARVWGGRGRRIEFLVRDRESES